MGFKKLLDGLEFSGPTNLSQSIFELEDTSTIFMQRVRTRDHERAHLASTSAMTHLDFIVNEILREKVDRLGLGIYKFSPFAKEMDSPIGYGVTDITRADQISIMNAGAGNGRVPINRGNVVHLNLDRLLNKIKHRHRTIINFRFECDRHIFVICPEHTQGGAEGIYEFDVKEFCKKCIAVSKVL